MHTLSPETSAVNQPDTDLCIWLSRQAATIRQGAHPWCGFLADQVDDLAKSAAFSLACTPEDLIDRIEVLERSRVDRAVAEARRIGMGVIDYRGRTTDDLP